MRCLVFFSLLSGAVACSGESAVSAPNDVGSGAGDIASNDVEDGRAGLDDADAAESPDLPVEGDADDTDVAPPPDVPDPCPPGTPCDDGDGCTVEDTCTDQHQCSGLAKDCDDELACTADSCADGACAHALAEGFCLVGEGTACVKHGQTSPVAPCKRCDATAGVPLLLDLADGTLCEDGDACTVGELCALGQCTGGDPVTCFPNGPCTTPTCDPADGCVWPAKDGPCSDDDACTTDDACDGTDCVGSTLPCDDGDPCTADVCDPKSGCTHPSADLCDDGKPCTADVCGAGGACTNTEFTGPCEDGDPCTTGEDCFESNGALVCQGGDATVCDDASPCTDDVCKPGVGCVTEFALGKPPCFDGFGCTINDTCVAGLCIGTKAGCASCPVPVTKAAFRVVQMTFATDGLPGSGLDVDDDPTTCAPEGSCSGGIDNAMAALAPVINGPINDAMDIGNLHYVVDLSALVLDGTPFPFAVLDTELTAASAAASCDWTADECTYHASQFSFDPTCQPYFGLPNGSVHGTSFKGGGPGYHMTIAVALSGVGLIPITLRNAEVAGVLILDPDTKAVKGINGIFAGASPKQQLYDTIANLDPDVLPLDKAAVLALIDELLVNDIDLDGDGEDDSASVALRFVTLPADLE